MIEGIIWRYRVGTPWRDVPRSFGPWQTLWKRHRRYSSDETWDRIHAELLADADAAGEVDWAVSVDSTINRAHQHATNLPRDTGGSVELHEYDHEDYKGRNVVERGFNEMKQWRGLATRYDKLALTYRGGVVLRAITLWLRYSDGLRR